MATFATKVNIKNAGCREMIITPDQCRAARALLGWSQDDLENSSHVSKKTIAEFEREAQIPYEKNLREIEIAFRANGILLIKENGGGVGVRKDRPVARLTRSRVSHFDRSATLNITYKDEKFRVNLPTEILNDLDRTNHRSDGSLKEAIQKHLNLILVRTTAAIEEGRSTPANDV
jgi:transcriptional regulator with XRE-family HTH domain